MDAVILNIRDAIGDIAIIIDTIDMGAVVNDDTDIGTSTAPHIQESVVVSYIVTTKFIVVVTPTFCTGVEPKVVELNKKFFEADNFVVRCRHRVFSSIFCKLFNF